MDAKAIVTSAVAVLVTATPTFARSAAPATSWQLEVAAAADWYLTHGPQTERRDCSGLVEAVLERAGATAQGGSRDLYEQAERDGRLVATPGPGDLVFFGRTYDTSRNGGVDDGITHVAVVLAVEDDGTVVMVHRGSGRISTLRMNLRSPGTHRVGDKVVNDFLRAPGHGQTRAPRLAGQLFRGVARPPQRSAIATR